MTMGRGGAGWGRLGCLKDDEVTAEEKRICSRTNRRKSQREPFPSHSILHTQYWTHNTEHWTTATEEPGMWATSPIQCQQATGDTETVQCQQATGDTETVQYQQATGDTETVQCQQATGDTETVQCQQATGDTETALIPAAMTIPWISVSLTGDKYLIFTNNLFWSQTKTH